VRSVCCTVETKNAKSANREERGQLEDRGVDGKITLEWNLRSIIWWCLLH
jgi:hypothetical protein